MMNFEHGGNVYKFAKRNNIKITDIIDFSSNVSIQKPTFVSTNEESKESFDYSRLYPYPDSEYTQLRNSIIKRLNLNNNIDFELFNGASSGIFSLFRHVNPIKCTLYAPLYLEYKRLSTLYNCKINLINRFTDIKSNIMDDSFVIFVNPATPDGKLYQLDEYIDTWSKANCNILIDESFMDFTEQESIIDLIDKYDNLYVLKSFTKFYGAAGIRIGAVLSNPKNISDIKRFEPPWKLSTFDAYYLDKALNDHSFAYSSKKANYVHKNFLYEVLSTSRLIEKVYESDANFYLVKLRYHTAEELQTLLAPSNILIRDCFNFDYLDKYHVRFAVKDTRSIETLKQGLQDIENIESR